MRSLRARLFGVWVLSLAACGAVGFVLVQFYRQSTAALVSSGEAALSRACDHIRERYAFYVQDWTPSPDGLARFRAGLPAVVTMALARENGVEGGIWRAGEGSLAYAFPTYEGTGPKTDLPEAERDRIRAVNREAARTDRSVLSRSVARSQTLLFYACPLGGPVPGVTGWAMTRIEAAPANGRLRLGLGVLLGLMVILSAWLTHLVVSWSRRVARVEATLVRRTAETLPWIAPTGDRELDRIVGALNEAGQRLDAARRRSEELAARAAGAERLAALGRVAAGVAHEIRNPIAAIRLKAENALAGDDARRRTALAAVLDQVARLDRLVSELLSMTERRTPRLRRVALPDFLRDCAEDHRDIAAARGVTLLTHTELDEATCDADLARRALDNLVLNAIQHTPRGGTVTISAFRLGEMLRFQVADTGAGVAPEWAEHLFEPFVSGRAEGSGLGLAIAREFAEAQGGHAVLVSAGTESNNRGAVFALDLPWQPC